MATSEAEICNIALKRIGVKKRITSLSETSPEAVACNDVYAQTRDYVLECGADWDFATRRAVLAELAGHTREGWEHVYSLPADCVRPIAVNRMRAEQRAEKTPFVTELNDAGTAKILLCDEDDAELLYIARITTVPLFSASFVHAFAWALAAELALSLAVKPELGEKALKAYEAYIQRAAASSYNGQLPDMDPDSEIITGRE